MQFSFRLKTLVDLQMKELQDQLETEQSFSVSKTILNLHYLFSASKHKLYFQYYML